MKRFSKSLMARLVAVFLVVALIPTAIVGFFAFTSAKGALRQATLTALASARELAPDLKVTLKPGLKDMNVAEQVFRKFEAQTDGIVFLRTSGAKFLARAGPRIPCFVGDTNNPEFFGTIRNLFAPEGNITGVTYYIPYETRLRAIMALFPSTNSVGLLMEAGHPGVPIEREGTREQCKQLGIQYHEIIAGSDPELLQGVEELASKVDLFIIASHNLVQRNTPGLVKISRSKRIPIFAYAMIPLKMGAVAGVAAREDLLGRLLAETVVDVVVQGRPISRVPVKVDPEPRIGINEKEMDYFGLKLSPQVLRKVRLVKEK